MPHEGELAKYHSVTRIANSDDVKQFLSRCEVRDTRSIKESDDPASWLEISSPWRPRYVIAIDGSLQAMAARNGFPGAEICYLSVASVLLDMKKLKELDDRYPANPRDFDETRQVDADVSVFPGANVCLRGQATPKESFRRQMYDVMSSVRLTNDTGTLLDTYHALIAYRSASVTYQCPFDECENADKRAPLTNGEVVCPCALQRTLLSTDALRIHEGFHEVGANGAAFSEVMQVIERVWLIHVLRALEQKGWLSTLADLAVVVDGPLAVFGHPAWLKDAILKELSRINDVVQAKTGKQILVIGIEKSGAFADHFALLDVKEDGGPHRLKHGSVKLLTDSYIKRNIIFSDSDQPYGQQTYFGRKFFFKTTSGALIVGAVPMLSAESRDVEHATAGQFPRLADALGVLDSLVSSRYPNAVVPLVEAHAQAAIPRREGQRILEKLAKEALRKHVG